jgi:serine protease Do
MKHLGKFDFACLAVLVVVLGTAPGLLRGQNPSKPVQPPAPAAPPSPPPAPVQDRTDLELSMEQFQEQARTIGQEVAAELAELSARIAQAAQEVEMSSPGLSKLRDFSAQLDGRKEELISRAEELGARAEELANQVSQEVQEKAGEIFGQAPGMFMDSTEDGGGWLGIEIGEVTPEQARDLNLSSARGVVVMDVEPDSPAAKATVKEKDLITQCDGQVVEGTVQFRRLVRETPPGRTVALAISREGTSLNISVELGDRNAYFEKKMKGKMRDFGAMNVPPMPNFPPAGAPMPPDDRSQSAMDWGTPVLGINAEDLTPQLGAYFGAPDDGGVLVREVRAGTPAEKAGLKAGDVIVKVNGKTVRSLADLRTELREKSAEKSVTLGILRKGSEMSLPVAIEMPRQPEPARRPVRAQS